MVVKAHLVLEQIREVNNRRARVITDTHTDPHMERLRKLMRELMVLELIHRLC